MPTYMNPTRLADLTGGTTGADLNAIVNEAAIRAVRRNAMTVSEDDFLRAIQSFYESRPHQYLPLLSRNMTMSGK